MSKVAGNSETVVVAGRYLLGPVLGRGGMAEVRQSRDLKLQRPVALKLLRADLASDRALRARFEAEARSAARLQHPHVVSILDTGEEGGVPFIVMELLPGETLADRIREGRLEESTVRPLASQVLGALDAAHSAGILHRDVKPANILFDSEGAAKVADFGIAKSMEDGVAVTLTSAGDVLGTPAYLAPERAEGRAASPASDLWSLGVVLYEALTQQRPFSGDSALATALAAREGSMTPLGSIRPGLSARLVAAVERAVAPGPDDRFASAAAMAAGLGVELAGAGPSRRIDEDGPGPAEETKPLTATRLLSPSEVAVGLSSRLAVSDHGGRGPRPIGRRRPVHRRNHQSRPARRAWRAIGATAAVVVVALIVMGASGLLSSASRPGAADSGSSAHHRSGPSHPVASTPTTSSTTPTTVPTTVPASSTTAPIAAPSTSSPATTAPTAPPSTSSPATTAPPPTSPALSGHGRHLGQLRHGGKG